MCIRIRRTGGDTSSNGRMVGWKSETHSTERRSSQHEESSLTSLLDRRNARCFSALPGLPVHESIFRSI